MNLLILTTALLTSSFSDTTSSKFNTSPNGKININITVGNNANISNQPEWGPSGYEYVEFYYMPDIETYYCVSTHQYIYFTNFKWNFTSLPPKFREVDIYNCYKVVINEPKPYLNFKEHKEIFSTYKGLTQQQVIIKNTGDERFKACWKSTDYKVQSWEACSEKKIKRNLKKNM